MHCLLFFILSVSIPWKNLTILYFKVLDNINLIFYHSIYCFPIYVFFLVKNKKAPKVLFYYFFLFLRCYWKTHRDFKISCFDTSSLSIWKNVNPANSSVGLITNHLGSFHSENFLLIAGIHIQNPISIRSGHLSLLHLLRRGWHCFLFLLLLIK